MNSISFIKQWLLPPLLFKLLVKFAKYVRDIKYSKKYFKKNNELKNIHTEDRCFIIGLGSSIKKQDLTLLENEIVIGVSSLFNHKDIAKIKPNYYVLSPVFTYHAKYVKKENFIKWLRAMDESLENNVIMFIHIGDKKYIDEYDIFSKKTIYWNKYSVWMGGDIKNISLDAIPDINSVSETALAIALYLDFKKIYMLGFDHSWYEGVYHYFDNKKVFKYFGKTQHDIKKEHGFDSESHMIAHAEIFKKYKKLYQIKKNIFNVNSNENTYVDTFPKIKYEELFIKGENE